MRASVARAWCAARWAAVLAVLRAAGLPGLVLFAGGLGERPVATLVFLLFLSGVTFFLLLLLAAEASKSSSSDSSSSDSSSDDERASSSSSEGTASSSSSASSSLSGAGLRLLSKDSREMA